MKVVIVEDDVSLRAAIGAIMRRLGVDVRAEMPDGQAALDWLIRERADLILTDCQMPKIDGIALTRMLRRRGDPTPVIMISGQHERQVQELAISAGVNAYLIKPLSAAILQIAIEQQFPGWAA